MKVQNQSGVTEYQAKEGQELLSFLLSQGKVAKIETARAITKEVVVTTSKASRLFWFLFWLCFFPPMMILIYFFCGHRTSTVFHDGQFNVTLKDGSRFIIFSNKQYVLNWIKEVNKSSFLGNDFLAGGN
ncbi:hypothetical protein [Enterobacter hormaechei]|uniref:hypothetical protein n=1 Tax=Enterobacter hormaechei TaxID=158836 RepID=UPI003F43899C